MNEELIEVLMQQDLATLQEWQAEALQAVRAGSYITSAASGGGVSYAMARSITPRDWLAVLTQAIKRKQNPGMVHTVGQCSTVIFTRTLS